MFSLTTPDEEFLQTLNLAHFLSYQRKKHNDNYLWAFDSTEEDLSDRLCLYLRNNVLCVEIFGIEVADNREI